MGEGKAISHDLLDALKEEQAVLDRGGPAVRVVAVPARCPVCGMALGWMGERYRLAHLSADHEPCPECGRVFLTSGLTRHRKVHRRDGSQPGGAVEELRVLQARYDALVGYTRALEDVLTAEDVERVRDRFVSS